MLIIYAAVTRLNFAFIETYYLCRHCPFYAKEGRTLKCVTLEGLPRIWECNPAPISRGEQIAMMVVGGFIDLFPILTGGFAIWVLLSGGANLILLAVMIALTILMLGVAGYFGKYLANEYCAKCINFSCVMNKAPKSAAKEYIEKNPALKQAWEATGFNIEES